MITPMLAHIPTEAPLACSLSTEERATRKETELRDLLDARQETQELPDGYALRFPGDEEWAARLLAFIAFERRCCPFFTFTLVFAPEEGPLWLYLQGPAGTKELLAEWLAPASRRQ